MSGRLSGADGRGRGEQRNSQSTSPNAGRSLCQPIAAPRRVVEKECVCQAQQGGRPAKRAARSTGGQKKFRQVPGLPQAAAVEVIVPAKGNDSAFCQESRETRDSLNGSVGSVSSRLSLPEWGGRRSRTACHPGSAGAISNRFPFFDDVGTHKAQRLGRSSAQVFQQSEITSHGDRT